MALRLFRTTGYSTLLMPGESKLGRHPGWLVLAASVWIGIVCNVGVWRLFAHSASLREVLATAALLGGGSGVILGVLGWRRTLKFSVTVLLFAAALLATGVWVQALPLDALWQERPRVLLPPWPNFLRGPVLVLVLTLAVVPVVTVWNIHLRRLAGAVQLRVNITVAAIGAGVVMTGLLLAR